MGCVGRGRDVVWGLRVEGGTVYGYGEGRGMGAAGRGRDGVWVGGLGTGCVGRGRDRDGMALLRHRPCNALTRLNRHATAMRRCAKATQRFLRDPPLPLLRQSWPVAHPPPLRQTRSPPLLRPIHRHTQDIRLGAPHTNPHIRTGKGPAGGGHGHQVPVAHGRDGDAGPVHGVHPTLVLQIHERDGS